MLIESRTLRGLLAGLLLLTAFGCKKNVTAPPVAGLALTPVETTQSKLILAATVPSLTRTLERAAALAGTMQIPTTADDLRPIVLAGLLIPEPVFQNIAADKPAGFALVANDKPGADPHWAITVHAKDETAVRKIIDGMGKRVGGEKDAVKVETKAGGAGTFVWLLPRKDAIIAAISVEGLIAAGSQAIRALDDTKGDLFLTFHVDTAIKASGKDLRAELANLRHQGPDLAGTTKGQSALMDKYAAETVDVYLGWLMDMRVADMVVSIDPSDGLRLSGHVEPAKDSGLARDFALAPAEIDPAFTGTPAPAALFAAGASPSLMAIYARFLAALGEGDAPGSKELLAAGKELVALTTGANSGCVEVENDRLVYSTAAQLKPDAKPEAFLNAIDTLFRSSAIKSLLVEAGATIDWKRKGTGGRVTFAYTGPQAEPMREVMKAILGTENVTIVFATAGSRILATTEPGADKRLARMAKTKSAPTADVKLVLDETKGDGGFGYLDLLAFARPIINVAALKDQGARQANTMLKMLPGVSQLRIPIITRFRGGSPMLAEIFIPRRTFEGVGAVVGPLRGMMGGAMGGGAPSGSGGVLTPGQ